MGIKSPLKVPDEEGTLTLGQFNRARDAEAARSLAQDERRQERVQKEQQRQRELVLQEDALRRKRKALRLDRQRRLAIAERRRTNNE
jgi:hypothetical protein